jgi:spore maturation protein B
MSTVALLASAQSTNPSAIVGTALLATACSTAAGITAVKLLEKLRSFRLPAPEPPPAATARGEPCAHILDAEPAAAAAVSPIRWWGWLLLGLFLASFLFFFLSLACPQWLGRPLPAEVASQKPLVRVVNVISLLAVPFLAACFPLFAALRRIAVYEEFVEGAKEGFLVGVRIIPFLVAMLVAIGMFRGAGGIDLLTRVLQPALDLAGFPPELLPISLMRPLSGSASFALLSDLVGQYGPDSLLVRMAGTLFGSTETTFYVIAVYFGSVGIKRTRHAIPAGLIADLIGVIASVAICRVVFG